MKAIKYLGLFAFGAIAAVAAWFAFAPGQPAPQVTFTTLNGETLTTADLRGKVVLVNFWSTDCIGCIREMPKLVDIYTQLHPQGFEIVAVAMSYDPPNYVLNFAHKNRLPFKVVLDPMGKIAGSFGDIRLVPTSFVIDKGGRIVKQYLGEVDPPQLRALLENELGESG